MDNPLYAERYAEEMVNVLAELEIQQDPLIADAAVKAQIAAMRDDWLAKAREARDLQRGGTSAQFAEMQQYARGEGLLLDGTFYLSSDFETLPGPGLRLYLTTMVDPRDGEFPDASAIDLGPLVSPYGAQQYAVADLSDPLAYRTAVLWDTTLEKIYGFAQLAQ